MEPMVCYLNHFVPPFSHLSNGTNDSIYFIVLLNDDAFNKVFSTYRVCAHSVLTIQLLSSS